MKVIIAGSRDFDDYARLRHEVNHFLEEKKEETIEIISGSAQGADALGERYAKEKGYALKLFPANWTLYGKSAGPIRNRQMAEYADACIVFWDGTSRGAKSMIELAKSHGLLLYVVYYKKLGSEPERKEFL